MKDAAAVARFQREVEAAAKLEHPNIVTAYDAEKLAAFTSWSCNTSMVMTFRRGLKSLDR